MKFTNHFSLFNPFSVFCFVNEVLNAVVINALCCQLQPGQSCRILVIRIQVLFSAFLDTTPIDFGNSCSGIGGSAPKADVLYACGVRFEGSSWERSISACKV